MSQTVESGEKGEGLSEKSEEISEIHEDTEKCEGSRENEVSRSHCRFCATEMDCQDLFDLSTEDIVAKYKKLLLYLRLEVDFSSNNKLPKHACTVCHNACLDTYKFFLKVRKAQEDLNVLYSNKDGEGMDISDLSKDDSPMEIDVIQKMVIGKGVIKTEMDETYDDRTNPENSDTEPQSEENTQSVEKNKSAPTLRTLLKLPKKEIHEEESTSNVYLPKKTTYKIKKPAETKKSPKKKTDENIAKTVTFSWSSYLWSCDHCKVESNTMEELRLHTRYTHNCCYGFSCVDCNDEFNTFNAFVEHVRTHREYLRLFCQYCNKKFKNKVECALHALTHWSGGQKICELCGEIFPDHEALKTHRSAYRPKPLTHNTRRKKPRLVEDNVGSWEDYVWTCQDCYQVMPDINALRSHVREIHFKCFSIKCADCLRVHRSHGELVKHVYGHRPHLKQYCQYCNQHITNTEELETHVDQHYTGPQKPCYGCGEIFPNDEVLRKHILDYDSVRRPGPTKEDDLICDICNKKCETVGKLRIHRRIHEYKERCYVCDTCGNSYFNFWTYKLHIKIHGEHSEICKICKKGFPTKIKLKNHAKTHLDDRPFSCEHCGKSFKTKNKLTRHKIVHTDAKPYSCVICDKSFRHKNGLKVHSAQHTGERPYQCQFCDRTFTNNPNRDKHMRRRHGVPLYKAKEAPRVVTDMKCKEWLSQVTANQKKRRDVGEVSQEGQELQTEGTLQAI